MFKTIARTCAAALALAGFVSTAQATGLQGSDDGGWAGVYVGGHAGGGRGDAGIDATSINFGPQDSHDSFDLDGWLAGGHIGVNLQHGPWVMGGELSLSAADISGSRRECATLDLEFGQDIFPCKKADEWLLLGMSRFGYAPGNWMGYVTLGVAVVGAQTENTVEATVGGAAVFGPFPVAAGSSTDVGFAIGGGIEGQLGHGLIVGVEYIHADFDDMRDGSNQFVFDYDQEIDIVRARLSLMLDDCCRGAAAPSKTGFAGILPATGNTWSGAYFGGHVGGGWADGDVSLQGLDDRVLTDSLDQEGWLAGVHLGANVQRGAFVFGTELSLSAADIDATKDDNCFGVDIFSGRSTLGCSREDEWLLLAMSRIGYAPGNWMAYVTYGLAIVGSQTDITQNAPEDGIAGFPFTSGVNTDVGFAIGGGGELKLENVIAGIEYIHADFDEMRHGNGVLTTWERDMDLVRARLSLMLNACCENAAPSKMNLASAAAAGWGGLYFGSHIGYGWADATVLAQDLLLLSQDFQGTAVLTDGFDLEGYLAGGQIGGNVQRGALVVGGELSVSAAEIDGSKGESCFGFGIGEDTVDCKKDDEWLMLALARLGYAPGSWMAYVTAGAAVVGAQTDVISGAAAFSAGSDTDLGYAVGGGAELQLGHGLIAGVEYIHAEFDGMKDGGLLLISDWEQDMDIVRARLSVKLGGCCGAAPTPWK